MMPNCFILPMPGWRSHLIIYCVPAKNVKTLFALLRSHRKLVELIDTFTKAGVLWSYVEEKLDYPAETTDFRRATTILSLADAKDRTRVAAVTRGGGLPCAIQMLLCEAFVSSRENLSSGFATS